MTILHNHDINEPPAELDGAEVILWAFNPHKPFFIMKFSDGRPYKPIHGLAICRYKGKKGVYRFSCDSEWNVENDLDYDSVEAAIQGANDLSGESICWNQRQV